MGHLARCMSIAGKISDFSATSFMVSTDSRISVETFIRQHTAGFNIERLLFIGALKMEDEIELLIRFLHENNAYLVLDHYEVNEETMFITEVLERQKNDTKICREKQVRNFY